MVGEAVRLHYYEGEQLRFIKGVLIEETQDFVKIELDNYITSINKKEIAKLEIAKQGG